SSRYSSTAYHRKEVDAVATRALEVLRKGETAHFRQQVCPKEEGCRACLETNHEFVFALTEAFGNNGALQSRGKCRTKLPQKEKVVMHRQPLSAFVNDELKSVESQRY